MKTVNLQTSNRVFQYFKKAFGIFTLTLLLFSSFLLLNHNAEAQQLVCPQRAIQQITFEEEGFSERVSINADGTLIAFESSANINGGNPDGNDEIWFANARTEIITQITNDPVRSSRQASISATGSLIAFNSDADFTGGNPDGNFEIWLANVTTGMITQITDTMMPSESNDPSLSGDGLFIAFASDANINGGNPDGNFEVWLANVTTGVITQITDTPAGTFNDRPSINADGTLIAFNSDADFTGGNPDENFEIWLANVTTGMITQITNTTGENSFTPSISADGTRIAFDSRANINGGNPGGIRVVYIFDTTTSMFTQLASFEAINPAISRDGMRVGFSSDANINGGNPEENEEIYIFEIATVVITQITNEPSGQSERPSVNADGTRIAFESRADIGGGNPEGNDEIYLAACFISEPIPTLSEWGLIAMAGILGIVGFMVMRRKKITA